MQKSLPGSAAARGLMPAAVVHPMVEPHHALEAVRRQRMVVGTHVDHHPLPAVPLMPADEFVALASCDAIAVVPVLARHAAKTMPDGLSTPVDRAIVIEELERRVRERTADLERANEYLQIEIAERKKAEEESLRHVAQLEAAANQIREQSLALTCLEEAIFWANAAIARRA